MTNPSYTAKTTNIKVYGKDGPSVIQFTYKPKYPGYTRSGIKKIVNDLAAQLNSTDQDFDIEVVLKYPEAWRSGPFTPSNEPINLYTYRHNTTSGMDKDDPGTYDQFIVYIAPMLIGGKRAPGIFNGLGIERLADALTLSLNEVTTIDGQIKIVAKRK